MKNLLKLIFLVAGLMFIGACENTELDLLDNPNAVTPDNAETGLVLNNVIIEMSEFVDEASDETMPYVRMSAMTGGNQYDNQDSPISFDGLWSKTYSEMIPDINLVIERAGEGGFTSQTGVAKTIKAYMLFTMVDLFGNIPYSEAFQGVENPSPAADDDQAVYEAALGILNEAIADLSNPVGSISFDAFYGGSTDKWLALANTLKIRYHVQTRLAGGSAGEINSIVSSGNFINSVSGDWQYQYGNNRTNPDSRHPYYADGYENGGPGWYMSNYMMWQMFGQKPTEDPRLRYYFYRQDCDETDEDQFTLDCPTELYPLHWPDGFPFCTASGPYGDPDDNYGGYWGRDHGNDDGIPPDDLKRTAWGLYPCGGKFDADDCHQVSNSGVDGGRGAGIQPIFLSSFTHFLLSEAALTMGVNGDPRAYLETGVRQSIEKVMGFESVAPVDAAFKPTQDQIDSYVSDVLDLYDAAGSTDDKLNVVINEFRLAAQGCGLEIFNAYRRTGMPFNMQPTREVDPGNFPRLMWYPSSYVNRNANASQRAITEQVFWDTNPADFIK